MSAGQDEGFSHSEAVSIKQVRSCKFCAGELSFEGVLIKMSEQIWRQSPSISRVRAHRGQTLIIVLGVMFVLLFIGGIFVSQIARNLASASRNRETSDAKAIAEAGVHYCDDQLMNSPEGADWRPTPSAPFTSPADPGGVTDPDYYWLHDLGGYARVPMKGGRREIGRAHV